MKSINNKGFTLIELVGIIVVLVAIFLIAFPSLLGILKKDEKKLYNEMVNNLCIASKTYIYSNMDLFPNLSEVGATFNVKIATLIGYDVVNNNEINPKTGNSISEDIIVIKVLEDNSLACEYIDS